ncbi:Glycosyltransferase involved in cell wall bisynthesis [Micromonospora coriariae]|uniref:Glycosyltransferase involved in cell wall bisynthesis n=1 Tax=Micromonospora coriariae TaxID=285665 RepID=A0A1C4UGF4_9ACTN|nr:glycosyltransferase [Micromonospora coriariae]SCE70753.1 Glycosyltransferase involved in cell wall bisynthesis [Micromonospora coriariae]
MTSTHEKQIHTQGPLASPRLRIVVLIKTNSGGAWILPQVEAMRGRGHEVILVLPPGPGRLTTELRERGFEVFECPFPLRPAPSTLAGLARLRRLIRRLRPDIVQYHLIASAYAARLATVGLPVRRVHSVAGPLYLDSPLIRTAERLMWRLDDVIVNGCANAAARYEALGCPPHRLPVATYGVDTSRFDPTESPPEQRVAARAALGVAPDAFLAIMVAYAYPPKRLVHRGRGIKGHDVLLDAWRLFREKREKHESFHLLLVGGGWTQAGETYRHSLIDRFGVNEDASITWLTSVPDVRPCYLAADVSVSPSLSESHGAAVEAGAMAVPSIVSDAGGLPETVDARSGWVVPRDDPPALAAALNDAYAEFTAGTLASRGSAARQRMVDQFDNRKTAEQVTDVCEQVAALVVRR